MSVQARAPSSTVSGAQGAPGGSTAPSANATTLWPGPNFELSRVLPGSVYLWACGERGEADETSAVSRSEACAGWVVLAAQILCYVELVIFSRNQPLQEGALSSDIQANASQNNPSYSIVAIAVAMYLLLSIAAADLWGGMALVLEGRGSGNFVWRSCRRFFGACLLVTFGSLVVASTRVLFYSSFENVDLLLSAAAVLFVADVDEKAMAVLATVGEEWRLFWVIEAIGSSFGLALLVVKVTGNGDAVREGDRCGSVWSTEGCSVYSWTFVLNYQPIAVTTLSLLISRAVSRPASCLVVRVFRPPSRSWVLFSLVLLSWISYILWCRSPYSNEWHFVGTSVVGVTIVVAGLALMVGIGYSRKLKAAYAAGAPRWRSVDQRRLLGLFWLGCIAISARLVLELVLVVAREREDISDEFEEKYYYRVFLRGLEVVEFLQAVLYLAVDTWLVFGMELPELLSPSLLDVDSSWALPSLLGSLLIGGGLYETTFVLDYWVSRGGFELVHHSRYIDPILTVALHVTWLMWQLLAGKLLWGWTLEVRAIAYWYAASRLIDTFALCWAGWIHAAVEQVVT